MITFKTVRKQPALTKPISTPLTNGLKVHLNDYGTLVNRWTGAHVITIDAEWSYAPHTVTLDKFKVANFLTAQYSWLESTGRKALIIWHPSYALPTTYDIPELTELFIIEADPHHTNPFTLGMCGKKSDLSILMFYAPHDVHALVGKDAWIAMLLAQTNSSKSVGNINAKIDKKRKLNGYRIDPDYGSLKLFDIIGTCTAGMGLDKFHESVGIESPYKKLSNDWDKSQMEVWLKSDPNTFIQYALGDVLFLESAVEKRVNQVNTMVADALGFDACYILPWLKPDPHTNQTRFPLSSGLLVSTTFEKYLEHTPVYNRALTALLPFTLFSDKPTQLHFNKLFLNEFNYGVSDGPLTNMPRKAINNSDANIQIYHPLSFSSIPALIYQHCGYTSSGLLTAIVYGGRCVNELQREDCINNVFDADLNSCYGSALTTLTLPIGFPTVYKTNPSDTNDLTLKEFLNKFESDMSDDTYTVYVDGKLNFEQDLIPSKPDVSATKISKLSTVFAGEESDITTDGELDRDDDVSHIPGTMVHILSELVNGCITSDLLKTIRAVSSEKELNAWYKLKVSTAVYYAKSGRVDSIDDFEQACAKHTPLKFVDAVPQFPNIWYPCPLSDFVGSLVNTRKVYKTKGKTDPHYNLLQNGLKLFINTTYGCLCSPYFKMGNTVIANVITARARLGAWMMAKSLGSVQSITDGGAYSNDTARHIKTTTVRDDLPSFHALANYQRTNKHRTIDTASLINEEFQQFKTRLHANDYTAIDTLETTAITHINKFWQHYGLTLPFSVEHKYENTADLMAISGSANYLLVGSKSKHTRELNGYQGSTVPTIGGYKTHPQTYTYTLKCRGVHQVSGETHCKESYLWHIARLANLTDLYKDSDGMLSQPVSKKRALLGVKEVQLNPDKYIGMGLLPGDESTTYEPFKPNENYKLPTDRATWERQKKAAEKYSRDFDKKLQTNGHRGIGFGVVKQDDPKRRGVIGSKHSEIYNLPKTIEEALVMSYLRADPTLSAKTVKARVKEIVETNPDITPTQWMTISLN